VESSKLSFLLSFGIFCEKIFPCKTLEKLPLLCSPVPNRTGQRLAQSVCAFLWPEGPGFNSS